MYILELHLSEYALNSASILLWDINKNHSYHHLVQLVGGWIQHLLGGKLGVIFLGDTTSPLFTLVLRCYNSTSTKLPTIAYKIVGAHSDNTFIKHWFGVLWDCFEMTHH